MDWKLRFKIIVCVLLLVRLIESLQSYLWIDVGQVQLASTWFLLTAITVIYMLFLPNASLFHRTVYYA